MTTEAVRYPDGYAVYRLDFSKSYAVRVKLWLKRINVWLRQFQFDEQGINGLKLVAAVVLVIGGWCAAANILG